MFKARQPLDQRILRSKPFWSSIRGLSVPSKRKTGTNFRWNRSKIGTDLQHSRHLGSSPGYRIGVRTFSSSRRLGLVGLPNVGKSTLFNAITRSQLASAENYAFCTIEPNVARVAIPDSQIKELASVYKSKKIVGAELEFVDIAGLIEGASDGKGMGNKFLSNVRDVHLILHVVRCFEDERIVNTQLDINPIRDIDIITQELILADLEAIEKKVGKKRYKVKTTGDPLREAAKARVYDAVLNALEDGRMANTVVLDGQFEEEAFRELQLLSAKPCLIVCNVDEDGVQWGNKFTKEVEEKYPQMTLCAALEAEASTLSVEEEREFLQAAGLEKTGLEAVVQEAMKMLDLSVFYSLGPEQATGWLAKANCSAVEAARTIHSDIADGFIRAEILRPEDVLRCGSEAEAKRRKLHRDEGKDYKVQPGDICYFKFQVARKTKKK